MVSALKAAIQAPSAQPQAIPAPVTVLHHQTSATPPKPKEEPSTPNVVRYDAPQLEPISAQAFKKLQLQQLDIILKNNEQKYNDKKFQIIREILLALPKMKPEKIDKVWNKINGALLSIIEFIKANPSQAPSAESQPQVPPAPQADEKTRLATNLAWGQAESPRTPSPPKHYQSTVRYVPPASPSNATRVLVGKQVESPAAAPQQAPAPSTPQPDSKEKMIEIFQRFAADYKSAQGIEKQSEVVKQKLIEFLNMGVNHHEIARNLKTYFPDNYKAVGRMLLMVKPFAEAEIQGQHQHQPRRP